MKQYLDILGLTAKDKVTGFEGVCTAVSFLLDGHVICALAPAIDPVSNKVRSPQAFDHNRLDITNHIVVVPAPQWSIDTSGEVLSSEQRLSAGVGAR